MKAFSEVQDLTRDLIKTGTVELPDYFLNDSVISDDGNQRDTIEQALEDRGFVVIVDPPVSGKIYNRAPSIAHCDVLIPVHVQVNPKTNPAGAGVSITVALQEVICAILQYAGLDGDNADRYDVDDTPFELVVNDDGLYAYVILFRKTVVFS
jgi:hypothetical protein